MKTKIFSDIGRDEQFTEIPLERLENGLTANGDNKNTGLSMEASNGNFFLKCNYSMKKKTY